MTNYLSLLRFFCYLLITLLTSTSAIASYQEIIKSDNDSRTFKAIKLENGLKVMLVQDHSALFAAASLSIKAGSLHNPKEIPGLYHFLEHMLFLGTKEYPDSNEYGKFISENAGYSNAFTANDRTNYHFKIDSEKFEEALSRFSRFFVTPLFNEELVRKELEAVNGEHSTHKLADLYRVFQTSKIFFSPDSPLSNFSTGNEETLNIPNIRERVIEAYEKRYSADKMNLTLVANLPIERLEKIAKKEFSDILVRKPVKEVKTLALVNPEIQLPSILKVKTIKETKTLSFNFKFAERNSLEYRDSLMYLAKIIGCESQGCPAEILKKENMVLSLHSQVEIVENYFVGLSISTELTDKGEQNIERIGKVIFDYIQLVKTKGVETWRFEEEKKIAQYNFSQTEKKSPVRTAVTISEKLHTTEPEKVLTDGVIPGKFDIKKINKILSYLAPNNLFLVQTNQKVKGNKVENWYSTEYSIEPLSKSTTRLWQQSLKADSIPNVLYRLPAKNQYMSKNDEIEKPAQIYLIPQKIISNDQLEMWFMNDTTDNSKKVFLNIDFERTKYSDNSEKNRAYNNILLMYLNDYIKSYYLPAFYAGNTVSFSKSNNKITLTIVAYPDIIPQLLKNVLNDIYNKTPNEEKFNALVNNTKRKNADFSKERAIKYVFKMFTYLTRSSNPYLPDIFKAYDSMTYKEAQNNYKKTFNNLKVKAFLFGNITEKKSDAVIKIINESLKNKDIKPNSKIPLGVLDIAPGNKIIQTKLDHNDNVMVTNYQLPYKDFKQSAGIKLISHIIRSKYFNDLRTQKQLGYIVGSSPKSPHFSDNYIFYVQSPKTSPKEIDAITDEFFIDTQKIIKELDNKKLKELIRATKTAYLKPIINQNERFKKYNNALKIGDTEFKFNQPYVDALETLNVKYINSLYEQLFSKNKREKLTLLGKAGKDTFKQQDFIDFASELKKLKENSPQLKANEFKELY